MKETYIRAFSAPMSIFKKQKFEYNSNIKNRHR